MTTTDPTEMIRNLRKTAEIGAFKAVEAGTYVAPADAADMIELLTATAQADVREALTLSAQDLESFVEFEGWLLEYRRTMNPDVFLLWARDMVDSGKKLLSIRDRLLDAALTIPTAHTQVTDGAKGEGVTAEAIARACDPLWWAWWDKGSDADREWAWRHHANEIERGEKLLVALRPFFATPPIPQREDFRDLLTEALPCVDDIAFSDRNAAGLAERIRTALDGAVPAISGEGEKLREALEARDTAQSLVEAWAGACESLEAHLQDRVAMNDEANPAAYLSILRGNMTNVQRFSEQVRAARWADYSRQNERIAQLEAALATPDAAPIGSDDAGDAK